MDVEVRVFGGLTERIGASRTRVSLPADATVADLRAVLASEFPGVAGLLPSTNVALDLEVADDDARLAGASEIALLPPVAGGAGTSDEGWTDDPGTVPPVRLRDGVRIMTGLGAPPFDVDAVTDAIATPAVGACVSFLGRVRDHAPDLDGVVGLEYSAYPAMAQKVLDDIADELISREPDLVGLALLHAVGDLPVGAHTILVAATAAHRQTAFRAAEDALEHVKQRTPVWKRERTRDGEHRWVGLPEGGAEPGVRVLPAREAAALLDDASTVVLDVRTDAELAQARIPGANQLDFYAEGFGERLATLDPTRRYLLYCRSGQRTAHVRQMMEQLGFTDVVDVEGGLMAWAAQGLPLER